MRLSVCGLAVLLVSCAPLRSPSGVDPALAAEIDRTRAIDNHAHPNVNDADHDFDALPMEVMEPMPMPFRLDPNNTDFKVRDHAATPNAVLDAAGIDIMLANRIAMAPGLDPKRFRWVPFADAFLFPLANDNGARRDHDRKAFFEAEEKLLKRYLGDAGLSALPETFDDYLAFVSKTLERQRGQGAVAEKFELAYLRTLAAGPGDKAEAAKLYSTFRKGGVPGDSEYKVLQDTLFRHIAAECGRLGMAVHVHSFAGAGAHFDMAGANPMNLEPLFNDPALAKTRFVIVHGGWPFTREVQALMFKPNVYADVSMLGLALYPKALGEAMRGWLEYMPDRVLFGTDAGPFGPGIGFDETARVSARGVRQALGLALTGMVRDGQITHERAVELAHMVLRDNARKLYGIQ